jgi:putative membrane protein
MNELKVKNTFEKSREHLANERKFLAWIRTSIALMAFGFVIVKFSLFLKEIALLLESNSVSSKGYSAIVGVIMVALGVILAILAFLQYKKYEYQLNNNSYISSSLLSLFMTLIILISGIILILYLLSITSA